MNYNEIKDCLFQSEIIQKIPDKWQQAPTLMCKYKDDLCDTFLFYNEHDKIEVKLMVLVSSSTGEVVSLSPEDIKSNFSVSKLSFERKIIDDYDSYFSSKSQYEILYAEYHEKVISAKKLDVYSDEMKKLYIEIINEDFYNEFHSAFTNF